MNPFFEKNHALFWTGNGETLMLTPWGQDSIRVRSVLMGEIADNRFALLDPAEAREVSIQITEDTACMTVGKLTAKIELDSWQKYGRLSFYDRKERLLLRETSTGNALSLKARKFEPHLGGDYRLHVTFDGTPGERIYGMGQYQEQRTNWKGCTLELAQRNSQVSIPFYMSSLGYGFLWHNPAIGQVTFGENRTTWSADSTRQMDYWITAGDTPAEISRNYALATGFVPMMPEYGLGFWQCKLRYWNQEQLLSVAREYKRRGLPIDVIVCDYFHWPHLGDFRFDPDFFPDPQAMVRELKEMGIHLMVSVWPLVGISSENYGEMLQKGYLVRAEYGEQIAKRFVEDSMVLDATNPDARQYVWDKVNANYYRYGIDTFWLDDAEPGYGVYDFRNFRYHIGSAEQTGNIYPQYYARLFYEGMRSAGQTEIVNLLRCAWSGSQRYGTLVWSGDVMSRWEDFRRQICAGISMGVAGIPWWTTDIGGFHSGDIRDPNFHELLIRWFQWGTYCPVMRLHGDRKPFSEVRHPDGTPTLRTGAENEVWTYGENNYEIMVKYMRRRESMRDYIRGLMKLAHENGTPLLRAMWYEFPEDPDCIQLNDQYMFGDRYLVAPVLEAGVTERKVYFPAGQWKSVDTGACISGPGFRIVPAPLDVMPVYEKI